MQPLWLLLVVVLGLSVVGLHQVNSEEVYVLDSQRAAESGFEIYEYLGLYQSELT